jgi:HEPN domain-containing protein
MPNLELANKWLEYARTDYNVAIHDTTFHPVPIEIICYHCEQAAEKALKAILAYHNETIPHIHDLYRILELCLTHVPQLSALSSQARRLTDFAIITRYPNNIQLNDVDMKQAIVYADQFIKLVEPLWSIETK